MMSVKQLCFLVLIVAVTCHVSGKNGSKTKLAKTKTPTAKEGEPQVTTGECDGVVRGGCIGGSQFIISNCPKDREAYCHFGLLMEIKPCTCVDGKHLKYLPCKDADDKDCHYGYHDVMESCEGGEMGWNGCNNSVQFTCYNNETTVFSSCPKYDVDGCSYGIKLDYPVPCEGGITGPSFGCDPNDDTCTEDLDTWLGQARR